jgi:hypothetical protein
MIEMLGLLYVIGKDLKQYFDWKVEDKLVDRQWLDKSGFKDQMEREGYILKWSADAKLESWLLSGYEIVYEIDKPKRVRRRIVRAPRNRPDVLIGKKRETQ